MRARRRLGPGEPDNFAFETSQSALAFFDEDQGKMLAFGTALPAIGLIVGAMVIMNIMLVAVAERTREIGVRKALGARRKDIMRQFLVEAATLSLLGAALGVAPRARRGEGCSRWRSRSCRRASRRGRSSRRW
jgi:putative ABC transport system permease protein